MGGLHTFANGIKRCRCDQSDYVEHCCLVRGAFDDLPPLNCHLIESSWDVSSPRYIEYDKPVRHSAQRSVTMPWPQVIRMQVA